MVVEDLELEDRTVDIIGLYLHPPQHAAVFCVDEMPPVLAPYRYGTLSLFDAFDAGLGEVLDNKASRHTSAGFVTFLTDIVASQPRGKEIHVVADNLSDHRTMQVDDFLPADRTVHLTFTPSYSSWLNEIAPWFSKIESDIDAYGVLPPHSGLKRKLMRYIRHYNKAPKTLKWKYFDPACRVVIDSDGTLH
jgi:transposase